MENLESLWGADVPQSPRIEASLYEVVLASPDVDRLSRFYEDALGYVGAKDGGLWRGHLAARRLAVCEGPANTIDRSVFAVADEAQLYDLRDRLKRAGVAFDEDRDPGLAGAPLHFADPDGNRLVFGMAIEADRTEAGHMLTARLQHVVYATERVGPLLGFYRDVVGFAPADVVLDETKDLTSVFLRCGEEHHSLAIFRAPHRRPDHICYDVEDWSHIRDWADRFAARHIPLRWGPGRHGPGNNLFLFVNDPDGNWLEFSAELERIDTPRPAGQWVHEARTLNSWGTAFLRS